MLFKKKEPEEFELGVTKYLDGQNQKQVMVEPKASKEEIEMESEPLTESLYSEIKLTAPKEGIELENNTWAALQNKSMPELWKLATSLGVSKNGKKDELIERILNAQKTQSEVKLSDGKNIVNMLDQLKGELKEFEQIREVMREKIEATNQLLPKLTEKQSMLEKENQDKETQIAEIEDLVPNLQEKLQTLENEISRTLEEMEQEKKVVDDKRQKASEIVALIPKLESKKYSIKKVIKKNQDEIAKNEEQIQQIRSIQKYGLDLLSTLMYATKKSG